MAWSEAAPRRRAASAAALLLAGMLAACATPPANGPDSPVVRLPVALAGIDDRRRDFAALFELALDSPDNGPASRWLAGLAPAPAVAGDSADAAHARRERFARRAGSTAVLVVPGLLGDCVAAQSVPFGDGIARTPERSLTDAYRQYDDLGLHSMRMVALPGRANSASNGRLLADAIADAAAEPGVERIVLVGYSKGVADALQALEHLRSNGGIPRHVHALVSVAGMVMGSALAERHGTLYAMLPHGAWLDCSASDGQELAEMTHTARAAWMAKHPLPASVRFYSVVALADPARTAPALRAFRAELAGIDPRNDGQMIAADAMLPGSSLLAQARADHWGIALPLDRHPAWTVRTLASGDRFPREALLRALLWWAAGD